LAIMLVVVVGVLSLAVNAQGPFQGAGGSGGQPRPARAHPGAASAPQSRPPRRPVKDRSERKAERQQASPPPAAPKEQQTPEADQPFGDLRPLNTQAQALVISVVDERTQGSVTRSRLTLRVQPKEGDAFEVTTRVAFPTQEARERVKVGANIPVRYDPDDHRRVVVDPDQEAGE
jgi:hypothetical protein